MNVMAVAGLPAPELPGVLLRWSFDPLVVAGLLTITLLYAAGLRRAAAAGRPWPRHRVRWFTAGVLTLALALLSPLETYAGVLLQLHMTQHMVLTMAAPPMLLLGAPMTLALVTLDRGVRRRLLRVVHSRPVQFLSHPLIAWTLFTVGLYVLYFTPLLGLAYRNAFVHAAVHVHFVASGVLFWWAIVGLDPSRHRLHPAAKLGWLFLTVPFHAFLGIAIMSSGTLLSPELARVPEWVGDPLAAQSSAGGLLWAAGELFTIAGVLGVLLAWSRQDAKEARRTDRRLAREAQQFTGGHAVPAAGQRQSEAAPRQVTGFRPARPGQPFRRVTAPTEAEEKPTSRT